MKLLLSSFLKDQADIVERRIGSKDAPDLEAGRYHSADVLANSLTTSRSSSLPHVSVGTADRSNAWNNLDHEPRDSVDLCLTASDRTPGVDGPAMSAGPNAATHGVAALSNWVWPPPPTSESGANAACDDKSVCTELRLSLDIQAVDEELYLNPFLRRFDGVTDRKLLQTVDLDATAGDTDDCVSVKSAVTRVAGPLFPDMLGGQCEGIVDLFEERLESISGENMTHVMDVLSAMQKILNVPLVALSTIDGDGVYLKTVGDMFYESKPVLGSFMDWILTLGHHFVANGPGESGTGDCLKDADASTSAVWKVENTLEHPVFSKSIYCKGSPHVRSFCTVPIYDTDLSGENTALLGYLHAMDRLSCGTANDRYMASFASVLSRYVGKQSYDNNDDVDEIPKNDKGFKASEKVDLKVVGHSRLSARHDRLAALFDNWHVPLEIHCDGEVMYRNQQFVDKMVPVIEAANFDSVSTPSAYLGPGKMESAQATSIPDVETVSLFSPSGAHSEQLLASLHLCSMLVLCSPTYDSSETPAPGQDDGTNNSSGPRYMVQYHEGSLRMGDIDSLVRKIEGIDMIEQAASSAHWCDCCDLHRNYECTFHGKRTFVEVVKYKLWTDRSLVTCSQSWIRGMERARENHGAHCNLLQNEACGIFGSGESPRGYWAIQETAMMSLSEGIGFKFTGMLKPLYVALTALDIARAIQHVHNMGMVYKDLNSSRVYLKKDSADKLRGWRAVLSLPGVEANIGLTEVGTDEALFTLCPHRRRRSCPEKILGCRSSFRSESFEFAILLWEMWEGMPVWPQISNDEGILEIICYERTVLGNSSLMPAPLRTIFHRCVGHWQHPAISNETIITMLQDWISKLLWDAGCSGGCQI